MQRDSHLNRRRFLAGTLASGAAAALPARAEAADPRSVEVVVVGAGLAGLSAARRLHSAGRSVIVLEARHRVGGRCFSRPIGAHATDVANMGATFVGPTQHHIKALAKELGIALFPTYNRGRLVWYQNGKRTAYTGTIPPGDPAAELELAFQTIPETDQMAATVPLEAPWKARRAAEWDAITVQSWGEQNIQQPGARSLLALAVEAVLSVELRDISMLYWLFYVHAAGGVEPLIANAGAGGAQDFRVAGGTQGIAIQTARRLGGRVLLSRPVRSIEQGPGRLIVHAEGATVACKRAIVAIPPHLAGRIAYAPELPAAREQLTQRVPMGSLIKTIAVYDEPFWRGRGLNGQANSDLGPVKSTFDASPRSGRPGVLMGFIDGDDARSLSGLPARERKARALQSYVRYFGPRAAHPREYFDQVWDREVYTGGCPVGVMPPGILTRYGSALRAPVGRIHWAGTETATSWVGYMDGAVQSGQRAAAEVLASL